MSRFKERLQALGFASYGDYLRGDHWREFKQAYRISGRPLVCAVCGGCPVQLHHHNYAHLGAESVEDVTPLCRPHHEAVHEWLTANGKMVNATAKAVRFLAGGTAKPLPKPQFANRKQMKSYKKAAKQFNRLRAKGATHPAVPSDYVPSAPTLDMLCRYVKWLQRSLNPSWGKTKSARKAGKKKQKAKAQRAHTAKKLEAAKALREHRGSHEQKMRNFLTRPRQ